MPIARSLFFMAVSTAARLGCGVLVFVVMARILGPEVFGTIMLWMSVSFMMVLLSSFGFAPYSLREIGARPEAARDIMSEVLTAKLILTALVILLAVIAIPFLDAAVRVVFPVVLVALLVDSFTEFINVGFRAVNRFGTEARVATIAALVQLAITSVIVWYLPTLIGAAIALLSARIAVLIITWIVQRRHFPLLRPSCVSGGLARIRQATAYAIDGGLQSLFGQIDSVVLNHYLGPAAVGIYQSGMRLFLGAAQAASVLTNVFLPRAAGALTDADRFGKESNLIRRMFLLIGLLVGSFFAIFPEQIVMLLYGSQYGDLVRLLPWFGGLFGVRFFAAGWGVVLTACGRQSFRAKMSLAHWILIFLLAAWWIPQSGSQGWLMALIVGSLTLGLLFWGNGRNISPVKLSSIATAAIAVVVTCKQMPIRDISTPPKMGDQTSPSQPTAMPARLADATISTRGDLI